MIYNLFSNKLPYSIIELKMIIIYIHIKKTKNLFYYLIKF